MVKKSAPKQNDTHEPDDAALFRTVVGEVKPLVQQNRMTPELPRHRPVSRPRTPSSAVPDTLSDFVAGETLNEFLRNGWSRMALRKLKRGNWPIQDALDLHGLNSDAARKLLQEFLHEAAQRELRCVLVIHGKGLNSPNGEAVLRKLARHWLTQYPQVLGYCDAQLRDGGSGAALVMLKAVKREA